VVQNSALHFLSVTSVASRKKAFLLFVFFAFFAAMISGFNPLLDP
jgi:hypothetical protein